MRRVLFAVQFLGAIVAFAVAIVVVAAMHSADTSPDAEPVLPDGNEHGDDLLTWAAEHPERTHAPEYLEDL